MAAEAQKVIPGKTSTRHGAQEMSIARLESVVSDILRLLEGLPPAYRVQALRLAETKIKPEIRNELIRKVSRKSRSYELVLPMHYASLEGRYRIVLTDNKLVYEKDENGDVRLRVNKSARNVRLSLPKWAYEQIGRPSYVKIRFEGSRIVIEPV